MTASSPGTIVGNHAVACVAFATRLKCESIAPLDSPVVPPV